CSASGITRAAEQAPLYGSASVSVRVVEPSLLGFGVRRATAAEQAPLYEGASVSVRFVEPSLLGFGNCKSSGASSALRGRIGDADYDPRAQARRIASGKATGFPLVGSTQVTTTSPSAYSVARSASSTTRCAMVIEVVPTRLHSSCTSTRPGQPSWRR